MTSYLQKLLSNQTHIKVVPSHEPFFEVDSLSDYDVLRTIPPKTLF